MPFEVKVVGTYFSEELTMIGDNFVAMMEIITLCHMPVETVSI
jgi:hypothetical protein